LGERITPTAFTWINADNNGVWEDAKNWSGGDGMTNYPGWNGTAATMNDTASFTGPSISIFGFHINYDSPCTMGQPHTLAQISLDSAYTHTLSLQGQLTLSGGASSVAGGTIAQTAAGTIDVQNLTSLTWAGGDINPSGAASTFTIESGGTVTFAQRNGSAGSGKFGDNLNNSGLLVLNNTNTGGDTLVNQPTITNNAGAEIRITNSNAPIGLAIPNGDPVVTIQNSGLIDMTVGGSYAIADPVNNKAATASISVQNGGTLRFKGPMRTVSA
jgi:hypothetical protein